MLSMVYQERVRTIKEDFLVRFETSLPIYAYPGWLIDSHSRRLASRYFGHQRWIKDQYGSSY